MQKKKKAIVRNPSGIRPWRGDRAGGAMALYLVDVAIEKNQMFWTLDIRHMDDVHSFPN